MNDGKRDFETRLLNAIRRLGTLGDSLGAMPHWTLTGEFLGRIGEVRRRIDELAAERGRKLAVVIVGPTGSGKSTLLNALAGRDDLAASGSRRPTTRTLTVFCSDPEDGRYFRGKVGSDMVRIESSRSANMLGNLVIVDTPDTNSVCAAEHEPLVAAAIRAADVLLCAFPAENAVRLDQIAYLGNWVRLFNHDALYAVVTMSEKLPAGEMERDVVEPLNEKLRANWGRAPFRIFAVSARSHLEKPDWSDGERPHPAHRDDYRRLRRELSENLNRAGAQDDMRAARAERWVMDLEAAVAGQARECAPFANQALDGIRKLEKSVWTETLRRSNRGTAVSGLEYAIASRLWGPVSWCLMAWAFIMQIVETLAAASEALRRAASIGLWGRERLEKRRPGVGVDEVAALAGELGAAAWPDIGAAAERAGLALECRDNPLHPPPRGEDFCAALADAARKRRDALVHKLADDMFRGFGKSLFLNVMFLFPALCFLYFMFRTYLTGGAAQAGIGTDTVWFLAVWWLTILSLAHGWIRWREGRLGDRARRAATLDECPPRGLATALTGELSRIIELAARRRESADDGDPPVR